MGTLSVNMKQMNRWIVTTDNVLFYNNIQKNKGKFFTLDSMLYHLYLNEFSIFYTFTPS